MEEQVKEKFDLKKELIELVKTFVICLAVVTLLTSFVFTPVQVEGDSMYPTLHDKSKGIVNIFLVKFGEVYRQDIVVVKYREENESWVKRVIGIPGDRISCKDDVVYVNGEPLDEPYLDTVYATQQRNRNGYFTTDFDEVVLGEDEYFLMGDNRVVSRDSRMVGVFKREDIVGKDVYVFYPFEHIGINRNSNH